MSLFRSLLITLSTYTRIPLPPVDFQEEDMRYGLCFLPLVGVLICFFFRAWALLVEAASFGSLLKAAGYSLIPLWLTGGIHMDGFLDTSDALASWQSCEKKLEIMKDPHMGVFALIRGGMYMLAIAGLYSEINTGKEAVAIGTGFVLSRCLVGLMTLLLPNARRTGMIHSFQKKQEKKATLIAAAIFILISLVIGCLAVGFRLLPGIAAIAATAIYFYFLAKKQFGGITGDLAGYFIQISELAFAAGVILLGGLI